MVSEDSSFFFPLMWRKVARQQLGSAETPKQKAITRRKLQGSDFETSPSSRGCFVAQMAPLHPENRKATKPMMQRVWESHILRLGGDHESFHLNPFILSAYRVQTRTPLPRHKTHNLCVISLPCFKDFEWKTPPQSCRQTILAGNCSCKKQI